MLKTVGTFRGHDLVIIEIVGILKINGQDGYKIQKYKKGSEGKREKEKALFFSDQFITHERFMTYPLNKITEFDRE